MVFNIGKTLDKEFNTWKERNMENTKHTAGPWTVTKYSNYTGWSIYADGKGCIAERWYDNPEHAGYSTEEMAANAALIAAAPDLLEALKLALEASTQGRDDYSWEDAAIAAIAKAEGR